MAILGTLEVRLHSGKHMKNVEFFGKNDPYAIVCYKTQEQKSKTLENSGSNPVWNQSFFFELEEGPVADVIIKILDEDKHTADDIIGEATIVLGNVLTELAVPASAYDLVRSSGDETFGQIEVSLKFSPHKAPVKPHIASPPHIQHHQHHSNPEHHKYDGPYGDNNEEGGWK